MIKEFFFLIWRMYEYMRAEMETKPLQIFKKVKQNLYRLEKYLEII